MSSATVDVSVIILTWNSAHHIGQCLDSVLADLASANLSHEVFVVDNGSKDGTRHILEKFLACHGSRLTPIYLPRNAGTTVPRNLALRQASGKFISILDSDAYPRPGCFKALVSRLESSPCIGMVVPRLLYPDGRYQKSTDVFPTLPRKLYRLFFLRRLEEHERALGEGPVDYAISAFWMMRREVPDRIGLLDEKIFYSPEDADYCLRIWRGGWAVYYAPDALAIHAAQERSRSFALTRFQWLHFLGLLYYFRKHRHLLSRPRRERVGS